MPVYSYRCPECMDAFTRPSNVASRNQRVECRRCAFFDDRVVVCERIPDGPNFTVRGFRAANGYSKSS